VKIIDTNGRVTPRGTAGELLTRGYSVMRGYWDDASARGMRSTPALDDTGDLAVIDEQGYCNIVAA